VNVHTASKDDIEVRRGLGIVSLQVAPRAGAVVVDSVGFGAMHGPDGFALGYRAATTAALPRDGCRLLVWVKTEGELAELKGLLQERADICVVRPNI
jgi:hypothetical protein